MTKKSIQIEYTEIDHYTDLDKKDQELIEEAISFSKNAYAPYSDFYVSAVLRLSSGEIVKATNVENASYPVSICAERNLLAHTTSNYPDSTILEIVIYVDKDLEEPVSPCGMCRQSLCESESNQDDPIRIYLVSKSGKTLIFERCSDLLPLSFSGNVL